jgi:hypothetical protein
VDSDDGFGLSVWEKRVLELPVLTIGSRRPARHRFYDMNSNENAEPYEVVVKHDSIGVLHNASFQTLNQAHAYLRACWAKLPVESDIYIQFGGAIYDKHNSRKRVLTFGADYLTEENGDKPA